MSKSTSSKRRLILSRLLKLLVLISFIFILFTFLSSLTTNLNDGNKATSSHWVMTLPVSGLIPGEVKALPWSGGLVWVYSRTEEDLRSLKERNSLLRDVTSENSDQPENMKTSTRSASELFFVFIPLENKKRCQVRLYQDEKDIRFTEPCYGAKFDAAGRVFENSGHSDQKNLSVPVHVIESGILKIAIWLPK